MMSAIDSEFAHLLPDGLKISLLANTSGTAEGKPASRQDRGITGVNGRLLLLAGDCLLVSDGLTLLRSRRGGCGTLLRGFLLVVLR